MPTPEKLTHVLPPSVKSILSWEVNYLVPHARPELLPAAGAPQRLEAVSSRPVLGACWLQVTAKHVELRRFLNSVAGPAAPA